MTDLSVIIPIYNAEAHLEALVATLREQRVLGPEATINAEVLLVDDGSNDASPAMLDRIAHEHPAVVVLQSRHGGPAEARNAGLAAASGKYVYLMDQDDYIVPGTLVRMLGVLAEHDADAVQFRYKPVRPCEVEEWRGRECADAVEGVMTGVEFLVGDRLRWNMGLWNKLYSLDVIRRHGIAFDKAVCSYHEDDVFNYRYFLHSRRVACVDSVGYLWIQYPMSLSNNQSYAHKVRRQSEGRHLAAFFRDLHASYKAEECSDATLAHWFYDNYRWNMLAYWGFVLRMKCLSRRDAMRLVGEQSRDGLLPVAGGFPRMGKGYPQGMSHRLMWAVVRRPMLLRMALWLRLSKAAPEQTREK